MNTIVTALVLLPLLPSTHVISAITSTSSTLLLILCTWFSTYLAILAVEHGLRRACGCASSALQSVHFPQLRTIRPHLAKKKEGVDRRKQTFKQFHIKGNILNHLEN